MQLRVPHRGAAPQAANQKATLLEWEVYSPTSVNPVFLQVGITASHILTVCLFKLLNLRIPQKSNVQHEIVHRCLNFGNTQSDTDKGYLNSHYFCAAYGLQLGVIIMGSCFVLIQYTANKYIGRQ